MEANIAKLEKLTALTGNWANKYGYFSTLEGTANDPTSINYGGSCAERIENLKMRGYGLYSNVGQRYSILYWQENCSRLTEEYRLSKIQKEEKILFDIQEAKDEEERLLEIELEIQRKQNEIKRKEITKVQPETIPETIPEIIPAVVATSSLIPLGILAILLINSSRGKK